MESGTVSRLLRETALFMVNTAGSRGQLKLKEINERDH